MKKLRYMVEAALLYSAFFVFSLLPAGTASALGGALARFIGPKLAASRKAMTNLQGALPDKTEGQRREIIADMWENMGRIFSEYPHLETIALNHTEMVGTEHIKKEKPSIFFGGHIGNWEIIPSSLLLKQDLKTSSLYRAPNNPAADKLLHKCRTLNDRLDTIPKSKSGTRQWMQTMQDGQSVALLIDQKYNEGLAVPFFGMEAMTGVAFIQMAQKFQVPLLPMRIERLDGINFRATLYPAIETEGRAVEDIIADAHALLEGWIRERPGQWLWLHRRWDQKVLNNA